MRGSHRAFLRPERTGFPIISCFLMLPNSGVVWKPTLKRLVISPEFPGGL